MSEYIDGLVSIVTPNYNCQKYIAETIESVLKQTYTNWEMLIVDDCSTDGSYETALEYSKKDTRIKVFRNENNLGAAVSRNKALDVANGEYIAFLDSDDLWLPEKLEKQIKFMQDNGCDFSFTEYDLIDENGKSLGKRAKVVKKLTYSKLLFHDYIGCLTAVYVHKKFATIRSYDIKSNNDYGLFLQILKKSEDALGYKISLAKYRVRKNALSRNKIRKIKPYFVLMCDKLKVPWCRAAFFLFCNVLIKFFWKYEKCLDIEK